MESATLGAPGGLVGASAGTIVVAVVVAAARHWTPLLDLAVAAYPAWRAGRVEPADALRGGV